MKTYIEMTLAFITLLSLTVMVFSLGALIWVERHDLVYLILKITATAFLVAIVSGAFFKVLVDWE